MTAQDLLGPQQLETSQPLGDAAVLVDVPVVLEDLGRDVGRMSEGLGNVSADRATWPTPRGRGHLDLPGDLKP